MSTHMQAAAGIVSLYIYIYIHACRHTYIHTYINTYIHTYIQTDNFMLFLSCTVPLIYLGYLSIWKHIQTPTTLGLGGACRKFIDKLKATQKGRAHPDPGFKKDKNMRLYKIFKHVEHKSARLSHETT